MPSPRDFVYKYFPIMTIVRLKIMPYIKRDLFNRLFPELETSVTFTSPFWRLRVGDFRSYEEAGNALIQLKRGFPQMAREIVCDSGQNTYTDTSGIYRITLSDGGEDSLFGSRRSNAAFVKNWPSTIELLFLC